MKNKDYVGHDKKPSKRSQKAPPSRPFPVLRATITLGLVGLFGYGLYFLVNDKEQSTTPVKISTPAKKKEQQVLPPPPKDEEWQFIEELENKEVQVSTEELEDKGPYVLRCATLRSEQRAEGLKAQIAFAGYESMVKPHQGTSGLWYRVDMGPFPKKRDAEKVRHALKRNNINGCEIWLWTYG